MTRAEINALCAARPGATLHHSFGPGHDVWKVGDKMFAVMGAADDGISLKTGGPDTAAMLIDAGVGERAPYLHASWVRLPPGSDDGEIAHRVRSSYALIRATLTKKAQAALPREDA
ncbi:MmcQ/YjbR family DNA-binding protein [Jannaschia sp. W003]|uniref:MmcQ/YjbR family DNA-binding protein n=1 Tax=Jannaschia sp. W003 TaxID=2867012 RepID=UPI0021A63E59|nr:MmcQ/YjbR family DNA-binding protein [Jannaschia sp. W003]UWQ22623.1 MmcQ/YjbR family DNA-binding protein [Jannaschia sp. W003]